MRTLFLFPTHFEAKKVFSLFGACALKASRPPRGKKIYSQVGDWFEVRAGDILKNANSSRGDDRIIFFVSGMACQASARTVADAVLTFAPDNIVLAGFAGACDPNLKIGDFVFEGAEKFSRLAAEKISAKFAKIVSVCEMASPSEKKFLYENENACAVEMEMSLFESAVKDSGVPAQFSHLRCISDCADAEIPLEKLGIGTDCAMGELNFCARSFIAGALRKPSLLVDFFKFVRHAAKAQKIYDVKIADFINAFISAKL